MPSLPASSWPPFMTSFGKITVPGFGCLNRISEVTPLVAKLLVKTPLPSMVSRLPGNTVVLGPSGDRMREFRLPEGNTLYVLPGFWAADKEAGWKSLQLAPVSQLAPPGCKTPAMVISSARLVGQTPKLAAGVLDTEPLPLARVTT